MTCVEVRALLEASHDNALDAKITKRVKDHLSACSSCGDELAQLRAISMFLQESRIPAPSAELDHRIMSAFRQKHQRARRSTWRLRSRGFLAGSISIPKPILAWASLVIVVALAGAVRIGMMASSHASANTSLPIQAGSTKSQMTRPMPADQIRIVQVPVVREKVRTIYVSAKRADSRGTKHRADSDTIGGALAMSGSVSENGYFTRANLTGFVPGEMKARVFSEEKEYEK